jgi:hypothetical protein
MNRLFGQSGVWTAIRHVLLGAGVLETDGVYQIGVKVMSYRIGPDWQNHGIHRAVVHDQRLLQRIGRYRNQPAQLSPRQGHIARWLREVRVDASAARPWIAQQGRSLRQHFTALRIAALQTGQAELVADRFGRVHSPVTNLRRKVRPALRIDGQELVELDVACAQPLLLGYLAGKLLSGDWKLSNVRRLGSAGRLDDAFDGMELSPCSIVPPPDLADYLAVCQGGHFYRAMADAWGLPCDSRRHLSAVKRLVFRRILFGHVRHGNGFWESFQRRWPTLASVLEMIKRDDHGTSARACQRLESRLMIDGVVETLRLYHAGLPIQTIHDSALVVRDPSAIETVRRVMQTEFQQRLGLSPRIKAG